MAMFTSRWQKTYRPGYWQVPSYKYGNKERRGGAFTITPKGLEFNQASNQQQVATTVDDNDDDGGKAG